MTAGEIAATAAVVAESAATVAEVSAGVFSAGASIAESTGNNGFNKDKVKTNTGNEIDITPSNNHTTVTENPGPKGTPDSSVGILDNQGNIATRRWYDSNGNAYRDVDMTNHGNPKTHPEFPHEHFGDWSNGYPIRK